MMGFFILFAIALTWTIGFACTRDGKPSSHESMQGDIDYMRQKNRMLKKQMKKERLDALRAWYGPRKFKQMVEEGRIKVD